MAFQTGSDSHDPAADSRPSLLSVRQLPGLRSGTGVPLHVNLTPGDILNVMDLGGCGTALMRQLASNPTARSGDAGTGGFDIRYLGLPGEAWPDRDLYRFMSVMKPYIRRCPEEAQMYGLQPGFGRNPGSLSMSANELPVRHQAFLSLCTQFNIATDSPLAVLACALCQLPDTCRLILLDGLDVFLASRDRHNALAMLSAFADSSSRAIVIASDCLRGCRPLSRHLHAQQPGTATSF